MTDVKETAERISDDLLASMLSEAVNEEWEDFALALRELQSLRAHRHADAQEGGEVAGQLNAAWLQGYKKGQVAAPSNPVVSDATSVAARFARLHGICRRILWVDASTPAMGNEQTKAAFDDLAEYLFADGINAALSVNPQSGSDKP